eukprot:TRINITY_DN22127_c0_g1_i1.p1 TRINITY_DN22127_c0_g1~~TRINITY_DN22127_c0_g1_i1.p1  ORF type:complete len:252 (+),score=52.73 TRINITY_DN22127_c0_g1_i1:33-758(+)
MTTSAEIGKEQSWLPLESNPDVLNKYIAQLGVSTEKWQFCDIFGTDPELLGMIPRPVIAVMLLFPITSVVIDAEKEERERIEKQGQPLSKNVWFMKQHIGNACGTIGVFHSLANNEDKLELDASSPLAEYLKRTRNQDPEAKCDELAKNESIAEAHVDTANQGQTATPDADADINLHFVAFVERDGHLYELDGRKPHPICHGTSSPDTLLEDAVKVISEFMTRDPSEVNFSLMALTAPGME